MSADTHVDSGFWAAFCRAAVVVAASRHPETTCACYAQRLTVMEGDSRLDVTMFKSGALLVVCGKKRSSEEIQRVFWVDFWNRSGRPGEAASGATTVAADLIGEWWPICRQRLSDSSDDAS